MMATYTGQLLCGDGHPNDDGLMPSSVRSLWLSENSRPAWIIGEPRRRPTYVWLPHAPDTILSDGLLMVVTLILEQHSLWRSVGIDIDPQQRPTIDLAKVITPDQHDALLNAARAASVGSRLKVIVAAFTGSSVLAQLSQTREFAFDVEVLAPVGSRLYDRWTRSTWLSGMLKEPDEGLLH